MTTTSARSVIKLLSFYDQSNIHNTPIFWQEFVCIWTVWRCCSCNYGSLKIPKIKQTLVVEDICDKLNSAAFLTIGVMSPLSVATATEMSTVGWIWMLSPDQWEFTFWTRYENKKKYKLCSYFLKCNFFLLFYKYIYFYI